MEIRSLKRNKKQNEKNWKKKINGKSNKSYGSASVALRSPAAK